MTLSVSASLQGVVLHCLAARALVENQLYVSCFSRAPEGDALYMNDLLYHDTRRFGRRGQKGWLACVTFPLLAGTIIYTLLHTREQTTRMTEGPGSPHSITNACMIPRSLSRVMILFFCFGGSFGNKSSYVSMNFELPPLFTSMRMKKE